MITPELLSWLQKRYTNVRIILSYENRADTTINPNIIGDFIEKWSYDTDDCNKYGMKFLPPAFYDSYAFDSTDFEKKYDVLYLGRDKGRLGKLLRIEDSLKSRGLTTHFHVCADRSFFMFKNFHYKKVISYQKYMELVKNSNAILNITRKGQTSITQRELEAVFFNVKCITTNPKIKEFELYDETRYFLLEENYDIDELAMFLKMPISKLDEEAKNAYKYEVVLSNMLNC